MDTHSIGVCIYVNQVNNCSPLPLSLIERIEKTSCRRFTLAQNLSAVTLFYISYLWPFSTDSTSSTRLDLARLSLRFDPRNEEPGT